MQQLTRGQDIAETILQQMGGSRNLRMMTGANNFYVIGTSLYISYPKAKHHKEGYTSNTVRIMYDEGKDLYKMEIYYRTQRRINICKVYTDVYCDQLIDLFEEGTGLYLTFGKRS